MELAVIHAAQRLESIDTRTQFIHAHVVLAAQQAVFQPGEEDHDPVRRHGGRRRNQLITVVPAVQIQKAVLPAEHLAALVQGTDVHADIIFFSREGDLNQFP